VSEVVSASARTAVIVANPKARGVHRALLEDVRAEVARSVPAPVLFAGRGSPETASWIAAVAAAAATRAQRLDIVCVGGDGTIRAIAEALARADAAWPAPGAVALGPTLSIVPAGSGNSVYRALWGEEPWRQSLRTALSDDGLRSELDLLHLREYDCVSVLGINAGLGGRVAQLLHGVAHVDDDRRWGAIGTALGDSRSYPGHVLVDGQQLFEGAITQVTIGGARHFMGGGFELLPRAELDDGKLDVCVVTALDDEALGTIAGLMPAGQHLTHPNVRYRQGNKVTLERTDGRPLTLEHDGDPQPGRARLTVTLLPRALSVSTNARRLANSIPAESRSVGSPAQTNGASHD